MVLYFTRYPRKKVYIFEQLGSPYLKSVLQYLLKDWNFFQMCPHWNFLQMYPHSFSKIIYILFFRSALFILRFSKISSFFWWFWWKDFYFDDFVSAGFNQPKRLFKAYKLYSSIIYFVKQVEITFLLGIFVKMLHFLLQRFWKFCQFNWWPAW